MRTILPNQDLAGSLNDDTAIPGDAGMGFREETNNTVVVPRQRCIEDHNDSELIVTNPQQHTNCPDQAASQKLVAATIFDDATYPPRSTAPNSRIDEELMKLLKNQNLTIT